MLCLEDAQRLSLLLPVSDASVASRFRFPSSELRSLRSLHTTMLDVCRLV